MGLDMGSVRSGQMVSRYNSLGWGVMVNDVLPSRGPQACAYSHYCPKVLRDECVAGSRCRHESIILNGYISSATEHYGYARLWLNELEYQQIVYELGVLSLQLGRLSARLAIEGHLDCLDGVVSKPFAVISRYATALSRRRSLLMHRLLDEETSAYWAGI